MMQHLTSPTMFEPFWIGSFLITDQEEWTQLPVSLILQTLLPYIIFFWVFVKDKA
jgi:hypothetical protein